MRYFVYLFLFLSMGCDLQKVTQQGSAGNAVESGPSEVAPVANSFSAANISIGREKIITLNYTDANSDLADSCIVSNLSHLVESTSCQCSAGICTVGVTGSTVASGSFSYTVTANSQISNEANVTLSVVERAPFVSTWRMGTSGFGNGSLTLTLPLSSSFNYDMTVDWGDGSATSHVTDYFDSTKTHTYSVAGDYTVTIRGFAEAWIGSYDDSMNGKLISVTDLGDLGWISLTRAFSYTPNLISFAGGYTEDVVDMSYMFSGAHKLVDADLSSFDTSKVTDMSYMFQNTLSLTSLDLSHFKTTNVSLTQAMFFGAISLTSLDISSFDTSNVTDMTLMFGSMRELTSLDLSHFNTSKVLEMNSMFYDMLKLNSLNISSFNTSEVTRMDMMFYGLKQLTSLDLSHFQTSKVTMMDSLFGNSSALTSITLGTWDLSAGPSGSSIFSGTSGSLQLYCAQPSGNFFGKICQ